MQTPEILESQGNQILTAIVNGMRIEEQSDHVKLAACNALINSLEFSRSNFSKDVSAAAASVASSYVQIFFANFLSFSFSKLKIERNYIMQIICEATQSANDQIKVSALQNLVKIMNLYYEYMDAYMDQALLAVSKIFLSLSHLTNMLPYKRKVYFYN